MEIPWVKRSQAQGAGAGMPARKDGSIYDGQLHYDLASESECANPRGQDI